jgi:glycosyltransferase involved in cell wall biosynthesis
MHSDEAMPRPLHVLTLTPFFPSSENEVSGCFVAEPLQQLLELGVESTVFAVSAMHHPKKYAAGDVAANWLRYPQLPGNFGLSSAGNFLYARLLGRVRELQRRKPIDVIHAHAALPCGHAAMLLSRRLGVPFVVTVHGLDVFNSGWLEGMPAAWRRKISQKVYRTAQTVICVSGKVREILTRGMAEEPRTALIYNGVDPEFFSPAPAIDSRGAEILVVGTLRRSKGHELVLRAIAALKDGFPKLRCRIVGEGPDRAEFVALAGQLGIEKEIQFVSRMSRGEVAEAMRSCSVFVLPSRSEGLGCVYLEAMSCAKPVIGCRGQGIEEVIRHGENGLLVEPGELEELMRWLSALLSSSELRTRVGAAAREKILAELTLSHQARELERVYNEATGCARQ